MCPDVRRNPSCEGDLKKTTKKQINCCVTTNLRDDGAATATLSTQKPEREVLCVKMLWRPQRAGGREGEEGEEGVGGGR